MPNLRPCERAPRNARRFAVLQVVLATCWLLCTWRPLAQALAGNARAAEADEPLPIPSDLAEPLVGHRLSYEQALNGWLSLFDGATVFGWQGADCIDNTLCGGTTTGRFGPCDVRIWCVEQGSLVHGEQEYRLTPGEHTVASEAVGPFTLADGLCISALLVKPQELAPLFNGRDLEGWQRVDRADLPEGRRPRWEVVDGAIHTQGGPGALEAQTRLGNLVLQVQARTRRYHANGGVFFRCQPGLFMMGYEAQILNRCRNGDPAQPIGWSTGAIDDRQAARRLVSPDGQWFLLTIVADGPHLATWVNGIQLVDWTDNRPPRDNPREGLRVAPGTIQLQAHDAESDLEFLSVTAAPLK
ncbi:MAG: DUF1080 domain-containing protein [Pirellulales bacterium]|nr:DUF1080 domain-containing protein [Pirellulales bacterium]